MRSSAYIDRVAPFMQRAIMLAQHGPVFDRNPRVGCVLLDEDFRPVAHGWHMGSGSDHAEIMALHMAQSCGARVHAAVVTLEPCNHTGQTGPCVRALIDAGVQHVIFGMHDPESNGATALSDAGLKVTCGLLEREILELCAKHLLPKVRQTPWVVGKRAQSLDGKMSAQDGSSKWITGEYARAHAHLIRSQVDAIAIGAKTLCRDDPSLVALDPCGQPYAAQPRVVIFSRRLALSPWHADEPCVLGCGKVHKLLGRNPVILSGEDLLQDIRSLYALGMRCVLLDGGAELFASFVREGLVDELYIYVAPKLIGGSTGVVDMGVRSVSDSGSLRISEVTRFGDNNLLIRASKPVQCDFCACPTRAQ